MHCRVLFFAAAADAAGARERTLILDPGATVEDAFETLCCDHPDLRGLDSTLAFAVDERYVSRRTPLHDRATLALIPPVSGG